MSDIIIFCDIYSLEKVKEKKKSVSVYVFLIIMRHQVSLIRVIPSYQLIFLFVLVNSTTKR